MSTVVRFPTRGDKAVRPSPSVAAWRWTVSTFPNMPAWYADFRLELLNFPAGKHDDIVDALGLVGQLLDYMQDGKKPDPKPEKLKDTGYRRYEFEPDKRLADLLGTEMAPNPNLLSPSMAGTATRAPFAAR